MWKLHLKAARPLDGWAFFENAGGSYPCRQVVERLNDYYRRTKVQPYGFYPASQAAGQAMDAAHGRLAGYLNVGVDDVHFGPSTSQNTYALAQAFAASWQPNDEIIVTNQDHEANSGAWRRLERSGVVIKEWSVDRDSGQLDVEQLEQLLCERTRLVAFPHCSNVIGHINPVNEITARAHAVGAVAVVDGVAMAPHGLPDVTALDADIYLFSLYKTFGPHQGLIVIRRELLDRLPNQGHFFNADNPRKRLVPAGPDHAQIAAAAGVADYFDALYAHHFQNDDAGPAEKRRAVQALFRDHENDLLKPLLDWLNDRQDIRVIGPASLDARAPTVSIVPKQKTNAEVLAGLRAHKIMAGGGHFYAVRPLQALGVPTDPGVIRLSFVHYTAPEEIERMIAALDEALS